MLLPAVQYGDWKDVRPKMRAIVKRLMRGDGLVEVMTEGGLLDTETTDGMLVIGGTLRPGKSFHCHAPWHMLFDELIKAKADDAVEDEVFRASLTTTWGVLGLMSPNNTSWFTARPAREEPFIQAALNAWTEIDAVGPRYFTSFEGRRIWEIMNSLQHVLACLGVPAERLREPLPKGGPAALLKYAVRPN